VIVLDANPDVASKGKLFKAAWAERYAGVIDYRPNHKLSDVDMRTNTLKFDFNDDVKADVLNVIPPMGAGNIARTAGLTTVDNRWCEVNFINATEEAGRMRFSDDGFSCTSVIGGKEPTSCSGLCLKIPQPTKQS
jgi:sulfide dehydrogenase [flavocytochrome c] flavoprotein chain